VTRTKHLFLTEGWNVGHDQDVGTKTRLKDARSRLRRGTRTTYSDFSGPTIDGENGPPTRNQGHDVRRLQLRLRD
jgi:hypothetical protein